MRFLITLLCTLVCVEARSACVEHVIQDGDTLAALAEVYFGDRSLWKKIAIQNNIQSTKIVVGESLYVYLEDEKDWKIECDHIIENYLNKRKISSDLFIPSIVFGIEAAEKYVSLSPNDKLFLCKAALATIKQESNFKFVIGKAGEVGYYQFLPATTQEVLKNNNIKISTKKEDLKNFLRDVSFATFLFVLHFSELKEKNGTFLAWYRYNGSGHRAKKYAKDVYNKFRVVENMPNFCCAVGSDD